MIQGFVIGDVRRRGRLTNTAAHHRSQRWVDPRMRSVALEPTRLGSSAAARVSRPRARNPRRRGGISVAPSAAPSSRITRAPAASNAATQSVCNAHCTGYRVRRCQGCLIPDAARCPFEPPAYSGVFARAHPPSTAGPRSTPLRPCWRARSPSGRPLFVVSFAARHASRVGIARVHSTRRPSSPPWVRRGSWSPYRPAILRRSEPRNKR